ncbi:MAG TPA: 3-methyl-2-oxobutanoate hydroxymethyltransferase [Acidobacteriaceae bacterium]|jgi:3-methyl-2-oxobutanoate hydroxymethyltransferase
MSHTQVRSSDSDAFAPKITVRTLLEKKRRKHPITALTAYDYPTSRLVDEAGIDMILVGDSVGNTVLGYESTLPLTMEEMLHHTRAVRRGVRHALLVADMPYGSYHVSPEETMRNALRFVQEAGAEAVKLEGGRSRAALVEQLTLAEIPVVGHIGLTPQSLLRMGGYRVQGRSLPEIENLLADAAALEGAGAVALVLEGVPRELAARITAAAKIPTIGIGAGPDCDGQILVFHDLFQLTFDPAAKFVRSFGDAGSLMRNGLKQYRSAVAARSFPADAESYHLPAEVSAEMKQSEEFADPIPLAS